MSADIIQFPKSQRRKMSLAHYVSIIMNLLMLIYIFFQQITIYALTNLQ